MWSLAVLLPAILYGCLGHSISKRETIINKQIDELIKDFNALVVSGGVESLPIDDISTTFEKKKGFLKLKGTFSATDGVVTDLSSLQRTGDATVLAAPTTVTITLRLGLQQLKVHYANYRATLDQIRVSGEVSLEVEKNSAIVQLTFTFEDEDSCSTALDQAYIESLEGFSVSVDNLGPLRWIYEKIVAWTIEKFRDDIAQKLQTSLTNAFLKRKAKDSICELVRFI